MARTSTGSRFTLRDFGTSINSAGGNIALTTTANLPIYNNTAFSIAFWVKINSLTTGVTFYGEANSAGGNQSLRFRTDGTTAGKLSMFGRDDSNNIFVGITSNDTVLVAGKWLHIAYTENNGTVAMYVNGVAINLSASSYTRGTCTFNTSTIGAYKNTTFNSQINAKFDDYRLYKKALSASEVQQIYYKGSEPDATNLIGYYKFDEGSGTTATDSSGNGNTGTITSGTYSSDVFMVPRTTSGSRLSVRDFVSCVSIPSGATAYIDCGTPSNLGLSGNNAYSIMAWVNLSTIISDGAIISYGAASSKRVISISFDSTGLFRSVHYANDHTYTIKAQLRKWQHVAIIYDGTTEYLYVNAVQLDSWNPSALSLQASDPFFIAKASWATTKAGKCLIDEPALYNVALSQTDLNNIYYSGIYKSTGLKALYFCNENTGTTIADSTSNNNTGTFSGSPAPEWSTDVFMVPRSAVT